MALTLKSAVAPKKPDTDYSSHLTSKPAQATTTLQHKDGKVWGDEQEQEDVVPGLFDGYKDMSVGIEGSRTINLGNFNSVRIGVSLRVPCNPGNVDDAYKWAFEWVGERINSEVAKAQGN